MCVCVCVWELAVTNKRRGRKGGKEGQREGDTKGERKETKGEECEIN